MGKKILIAPDKFKGTFTASEMAAHMAAELRRAGYEGEMVLRPLADGGEGSSVLLPYCRPVELGVYEAPGGEMLVSSSQLVGFESFVNTNLGLMQRSSYALGRAVRPHRPTYIAVGGTAVCDGGAGFLQGLGVKFYDSCGKLIDRRLTPATLCSVARADTSSLADYDLRGLVDVRADLYSGPLSALDFAAQKALPGEDLSLLPKALAHLQAVLGGNSEWDGAGGGVGYAIASVCKAPCQSGAERAIETLADLDWNSIGRVITGEGCVDAQTSLGGKLVDAVYRHAASRGIPTLIVAGRIDGPQRYPHTVILNSDWATDLEFSAQI